MPLLTAVLVLYRMSLDESACFQSLRSSLAGRPDSRDFTLLVYDNSPIGGEAVSFPATLVYRHDPANGGVAAAYNAGLAEARANRSEWLVLLDQDTVLTNEYIDELCRCVRHVRSEVAAIIPRLNQDGETHSPQKIPRLSHELLPAAVSGQLSIKVSAFNSGAALRTSAVKRFPERYWLDFLDHAIFHEIQAAGGRVWLMHASLQHSLSTQKLGEDASLQRYLNVLQAERDFYREYGSAIDKFFYRLRRMKQAAGQLAKVRDKGFALLSLRAAVGLLPTTPQRPVSQPQ